MASNQSHQDPASESLDGQQSRRNFLTVASGSALAGLLARLPQKCQNPLLRENYLPCF